MTTSSHAHSLAHQGAGDKSPATGTKPTAIAAEGMPIRRLAAEARAFVRRLSPSTRSMLVVCALVVAFINLGTVLRGRIDDHAHHISLRDAAILGHIERVAEIVDRRIEYRVRVLTGLLRLAPRDAQDRPNEAHLALEIETVLGQNAQVLYVDDAGRSAGVMSGAPVASPDALKWLATSAAWTAGVQVDVIGKGEDMVYAIPDGRNSGWRLIVVLPGDWLRTELEEQGGRSRLDFGLRDSSRDVLGDSGRLRLADMSHAGAAVEAALRQPDKVFVAAGASAAASKQMKAVNWLLYGSQDVRELESGFLIQALAETALSLALMLVPLALICRFVALRIYAPLEELKEWAFACGEGDLTRRLGWSRSRTDLADLGRVMDEMAAKLDRETKARAQFFAQMSHEIRTPMNAIIGFARLLQQGKDINATQREQLLMIRSSGESLLTIINDLLDFAKAEAGKLTLLPTPFRAGVLLRSVIAMMESLARGKNLDLRLKLVGDLDTVIVADEVRLRQVLVNLIGNAVKFTERGFVEVKAVLTVGSDGGARLMIVVSDTGPGLDKAVAERLFSPYSQANIEVSRKFGGTGLGLALCKQLSELMGGQLFVNSVAGVGTSFTFAFSVACGSETSLPQESVGATWATHSRQVLLVEDQFINQRLALAILERAGHCVTLAASGIEAISLARGADFDVILMDIQMPEMDGIEATKAIRSMGGHNALVPIIAVTAQALPDEIEKCLAAGMTEYAAKPIDDRQLLVSIQRLTSKEGEAPAEASGAIAGRNGGPGGGEIDSSHLNLAVVEQVEGAIGRDDAVMLWQKLAALLDQLLAEAPAEHDPGDLGKLAATAHKLVGAAGALGATATSELCRAIERDAKAGGDRELVRRVTRLSQVASESLEAINRRFNANITLSAPVASAVDRHARKD